MAEQTQIKVDLPADLKKALESKAKKFGLSTSVYVKYLIRKDTDKLPGKDDDGYPVYQASDSTEKAYRQAIKEYAEGKAIRVDDIDKFFDEL